MSKIGKPYKKSVELDRITSSDIDDTESLVTITNDDSTKEENIPYGEFRDYVTEGLRSAAVTGIVDPENEVIFSINADTTKFDHTAGRLQFSNAYDDPDNPTITFVDVPARAGIAVEDIAITPATFVYFDADGEIVQEKVLKGQDFIRDHVGGTILIHTEGTITNSSGFTPVALPNTQMSLSDLSFAQGNINANQLGQNEITGVTGTTKISKADGIFYYHSVYSRLSNKSPNIFPSPALTAPTLLLGWTVTDGTNGKFVQSTTGIEAGVYDDGTAVLADSGPQGTVGADEWVNNLVFFSVNAGQLIVQYGKTVYPTIVAAKLGIIAEFPDVLNVLESTVPLATVTMRGGATDLTDANDAEIRQAIPARAYFQ